jgi:hypothetical protein
MNTKAGKGRRPAILVRFFFISSDLLHTQKTENQEKLKQRQQYAAICRPFSRNSVQVGIPIREKNRKIKTLLPNSVMSSFLNVLTQSELAQDVHIPCPWIFELIG